MRVVGTSSSRRRYKLAQVQAAGVVAAAGRRQGGYFEDSTVLLHLFAGLGLVIADLNYCQA